MSRSRTRDSDEPPTYQEYTESYPLYQSRSAYSAAPSMTYSPSGASPFESVRYSTGTHYVLFGEKDSETTPLVKSRRRTWEQPQQKTSPMRSCWRKLPHFTLLIIAADVAMMAAAIGLNGGLEPLSRNPMFGPGPEVLVRLGAKDDRLIVDHGQWWRFVTPVFLHGGIVHLVLNGVATIQLGRQVESSIGAIRTGICYFAAGITGNIASCIFLPSFVSVGASGALFGLAGVLVADNIKNWSVHARPCCNLISLVISIVVGLAIGLMPMIDNFSHIGGLVGGIFVGCILVPTMFKRVSLESDDNDDDDEHHHIVSSDCNVRNVGFVILGSVGLLACLIGGLFAVFANVDVYQWCGWCYNLNCIEALDLCSTFQGGGGVKTTE
eukprot:TRINITY_DN27701_c0_g1_i1.p1 TRINITY_DN27701_c0_g1~~TRINITY_DN27701_c0_g1_i1.p1  ORF type:complete len:381 (-),score=69.75 TRINITY_DN27701_c0_g1_i1:170-1312(-)